VVTIAPCVRFQNSATGFLFSAPISHSEQALCEAWSEAGPVHDCGSHNVMENRIQFSVPSGVDIADANSNHLQRLAPGLHAGIAFFHFKNGDIRKDTCLIF
jgi:hypothetical protein